ncbi:nucleopolyhedrovirus P10 family protein, partial [Streptomyces sp. URMC 129]|uniref:nucleopolyhedrovirus P10 family protein n=1 Tax=Streptomyces sp. URMC 129 TaxID=3423407 RepID=UPI003F1AADF1
MGSDPLLREVRRQLSLGRLLPLGAPEDGAWVAESAAAALLLRAAGSVAGARADALRIGPAGGGVTAGAAGAAGVPPPPSGLPPGPLRIGASVAVSAERPLRESADAVRAALATAAAERLGLDVAAVDVEVTGLLPDAAPPAGAAPPASVPGTAPGSGPGAAVAAAVLAVPGVLALSGALGGPARAVEITDGGGVVRVQLAVGTDRRALDVARDAARAAVEVAGPGA